MTGILDVSSEQYHADQIADVPTLSRSIIHLLTTASPAHAREAHPKLNPNYVYEDEARFDVGNCAHDLFLGGPDRLAVIAADNFRTKAAQEERVQARVQGKIPLLAKDAGRVMEMVDALTRRLDDYEVDPPLFKDGKAEQTISWVDRGVAFRARADWLRHDCAALDDLKTTSRITGASREAFNRSLFSTGLDIQAALYIRGVEFITSIRPTFRFVVVETEPPYAVGVHTPGADILTIADKKIEWAMDVWRRCLDSGEWPGYEATVGVLRLPAYEESKWLAKELGEEWAA